METNAARCTLHCGFKQVHVKVRNVPEAMALNAEQQLLRSENVHKIKRSLNNSDFIYWSKAIKRRKKTTKQPRQKILNYIHFFHLLKADSESLLEYTEAAAYFLWVSWLWFPQSPKISLQHCQFRLTHGNVSVLYSIWSISFMLKVLKRSHKKNENTSFSSHDRRQALNHTVEKMAV